MTLPVTAVTAAEPDALRVFSFGGGWQSTAALALAARGDLDFRVFLFANVGDDSEDPATLAYVREHAAPFAAAHGLDLHTLSRIRRDGTTETLYGRLTGERPCPRCDATGRTWLADTDRPDTPANRLPEPRECPRCSGTGRAASRSLPIPVRMSNGAPGTRSCTADFKIKVIGRWLKAHGATADAPATVGVGISVDEIHRANARRAEKYERIVYPLLDLRLRRADCPGIIRAAGLPVPPKSACWFCPLHQFGRWADLRRERPTLFERACALEDLLNDRRDVLGKDHVYLSRYGTPLRKVVPDLQVLPFGEHAGDGGCDSGWCFT